VFAFAHHALQSIRGEWFFNPASLGSVQAILEALNMAYYDAGFIITR
jgi:hypothetical protein